MAISAALRWRHDHLTNIARRELHKNVHIKPPPLHQELADLKRMISERDGEMDALLNEGAVFLETLADLAARIAAGLGNGTAFTARRPARPDKNQPRRQPQPRNLPSPGGQVAGNRQRASTAGASELLKYKRVAAFLRAQIENGKISQGQVVRITDLTAQTGWARQTCARGLRSLEEEGLLTLAGGRGYHVTARPGQRRQGQA